ncbi:MAG TPA: four helix bundle protein [Sphingobacteriaceae bacterium]
MIKSYVDLEVYQLSYNFSMEIFELVRSFPPEEKYSLTSQVIRSSRSVSANIAEGFAKRVYEGEFKRHLVYSRGSLEESKVWLTYARDCKYLHPERHQALQLKADEIGAKLFKLFTNWKS